jgi:hypothetical protein
MSNEIIPYPSLTQADKEGIPDFRVPEGIDERALKMLGCNCKDVRIICGGRGRGKMMALKEFLKLLPEDKRKDVVIVRASDPIPELKGNKLPRIVDYDMMETSEPTWKFWKRIKAALKSI